MEHECNQHTYGNEAKVRFCCINAYLEAKALKDKYALTEYHPAAKATVRAWNRLTIAEINIVQSLMPK